MTPQTISKLILPRFQLITDSTGKPFAYEALLRFKASSISYNCLRSINQWEKTGFIQHIDLAMLEAINQTLDAAGWAPRITINVSVLTAEANSELFLSAMRRLAKQTPTLIVELTETEPIRDMAAVAQFFGECRSMGAQVALDDCRPSHAYGDINILRKLRPDFVKIDGQFLIESVAQADIDGGLERLIDDANAVGAKVIAEHVSSAKIRKFAVRSGAHYLQGYALGKPARLPLSQH